MKKILFIDGGGTKTNCQRWSIKSDNKFILEKSFTYQQMANPFVDLKLTFESIKFVISRLKTKTVTSIIISLAGWRNSKEQRILLNWIQEYAKLDDISIYADIDYLYWAFYNNKSILISIFGTGSSFVQTDLKNFGRYKYLGGWGHIISDIGSSYSLSLSLIKRAILEIDFKEERIFTNLMYEFFKVKTRIEFKNIFYLKSNKSFISGFLKFVIERLEEKGNIKILDKYFEQEISEVVKYFDFILNNYEINRLILAGSLVTTDNYYARYFINILNNNYKNLVIEKINWEAENESNPNYSFIKNKIIDGRRNKSII